MAKRPVNPIEAEARKILERPYSRVVVPDETGMFNAAILDFPGCFAQGATPAEAYASLEDAALGWVQDVLDKGEDVPSPLPQADHSGKFLLRLPRSLHGRVAQMAAREGVSINHFITTALAEKIGAASVTTTRTVVIWAPWGDTPVLGATSAERKLSPVGGTATVGPAVTERYVM